MADHQHHLIENHHQHHRPNRISLPKHTAAAAAAAASGGNPNTPTTSRLYPVYPFTPSSSSSTPSKQRLSSLPSFTSNSKPTTKSSLSFLFLLLLFSLRSLYSLLPFLRSSPPSFSLFPFSFLVSLLSFLLTLSFSFLSSNPSSLKNPFHPKPQNQIFLSPSSISHSQLRALFFKSILLAVVFLLRFQALRYCGTAALILAELSGNVTARFAFESRDQNFGGGFGQNRISKVRGFLALFFGLFLLAVSWDRIECFPLSAYSVEKFGVSVFPRDNCVRFWPMLLPFVSGFLGCYDRVWMNSGTIRQLGQKRVRLISLFFTTIVLFVPAVISVVVFEAEGDSVSFGNLIWPLANTVVFGVLLSENYSDEKLASSKDFRREFLVTFLCTLVLELFYFAELSLLGLLLCGLLLYVAVRELDPVYLNYLELGMEPESFSTSIMKPIRHILSERRSRKIALFLLINTGYMVVEFVAGFMSNSLGLISDACHMLFDCAALAIGLYASYISRLPANNQYNYGRGRFEVLSGYVNAVFLVLVGALIVLESFERILDPQEISTNSLLTVSIGGLVVNVVGLIFFHEEHHHAHGGCSQSHPHSHSHSHTHHHDQHSHDHTGHHHEDHGNHHECITVSHECLEKSCSDHGDHHEHHSCNTHGGADSCKDHISGGHDHHHDDAHRHDHHDHAHHYDHHDHAHQHEHHHHDHQHDHHHHDHQHHHHQADDDHVPDVHHHHHHSDGHNVADSHGQGAGSQALANSTKLSSGRDQPQKLHHHHIDHNMEGIFLHVLADTMGSVGVVISTLLIKYKGWLVADPACSIFISVLIVASVIPLLRNSAEVLLQRVPRMHEQELKEALNDVMKIRGICGIKNFHVWSFTNTDVVGTLNLHISAETDKASTKAHVSRILNDAGIKDLTLQVECVG